ncbi:MAG: hypothetical protein K1X44_06060 [Alphaproteobacteria bacterium]|nr:hypothetical protein [Alphaproteobacteria bacterium]
MYNNQIKFILITALSLSLTSCTNSNSSGGRTSGTSGWGTKETVGTIGGAALGGWAGSEIGKRGSTGNLAATAGLALVGAWLGNEIGSSLDRADQLEAQRSAASALEYNRDGQGSSWSNPNTNHNGSTTPTRTYQQNNGTWCRDYETTVTIDGRPQKATGTACRQANGTWRVVNS